MNQIKHLGGSDGKVSVNGELAVFGEGLHTILRNVSNVKSEREPVRCVEDNSIDLCERHNVQDGASADYCLLQRVVLGADVIYVDHCTGVGGK